MDRLLSVKEAALVLGIKPGTLQKWAQAERITHYRIGGRPKFKATDIERFIDSSKVSLRPSFARRANGQGIAISKSHS